MYNLKKTRDLFCSSKKYLGGTSTEYLTILNRTIMMYQYSQVFFCWIGANRKVFLERR